MALLEQSEQPASSRSGSPRLREYRPMLAALAAYVVVRGPVMFGGYLYADDFALRWWAHTSSLTPEYVFRSYYGHMQPFGLIAGWLMQWLFPGSFTALMIFTLIAQIATFALLWRIVLRLTGSNLAALLAFLVPAFSMFGFETGVWWVEITETVPYAFFMMVSIWALIRALEGQRGRWWLWSALAFVCAVASISKSGVGLIVLLMIAAALPIGVPRRRGMRAAFALKPVYWLSLLVVAVVWTLTVAAFVPQGRDPDWQLTRAIRYSVNMIFINIVGGSVGGPWKWVSAPGETWRGVLVVPQRSTTLLVLGILLLIAVFVVVRRYRPNLQAYLLWMIFYAAAITALAAYGRGGSAIASSGYRYTFDFWIPLSLFVGLFFYPVVGEEEPFTSRARALAERLAGRGVSRSGLAGLAAGLFAASCLASTVEPALRWVNSQTKAYVGEARESMDQIPADAEFLPQRTMTDLIHPLLMLPYASTEVVFAPDPAFRPFSEYTTNGLFGFATKGAAEQQYVSGVSSKPAGTCGYKVTTDPVTIPMASPVAEWSFVAQVGYAASADTTMRMAIGGAVHDVPVKAGLHNVFFQVVGPATTVTAVGSDPGVNVCIDQIVIGSRLGPGNPEPVYPPPQLPAA